MSYVEQDGFITIERQCLEQLFQALHFERVSMWDDDILIKRAALLCKIDDGGPVGEFREVLDTLMRYDAEHIVLRYNATFTTPVDTPSLSERLAYAKLHGKLITKPRKKGRKNSRRKRGELFSFSKSGIPVGAVLHLKRDPSITCIVTGPSYQVDFGDGDLSSFTAHTRKLLNVKSTTYLSPMNYWLYNNKLLQHYYHKVQLAED